MNTNTKVLNEYLSRYIIRTVFLFTKGRTELLNTLGIGIPRYIILIFLLVTKSVSIHL